MSMEFLIRNLIGIGIIVLIYLIAKIREVRRRPK
jgi:hypothetical protein